MESARLVDYPLTFFSATQARPGCRRFALHTAALCVVMALSACSDRPDFGSQEYPSNLPDWVRTEDGPPLPAQVGLTPAERTGHPMAALPVGIHWRLWRYEVPGIKQLSPPRSQPMDIALIAIDARITAIKYGALCRPNDCEPIRSEFAAIAMLVATPGSFAAAGLKLGSRVEYGQPSKRPTAQVHALP